MSRITETRDSIATPPQTKPEKVADIGRFLVESA